MYLSCLFLLLCTALPCVPCVPCVPCELERPDRPSESLFLPRVAVGVDLFLRGVVSTPACTCMPASLACRSSSVTICVSAAGLDLSMPSSYLVSIGHQSLDARVEVWHLIDTCGGTVAGRRRRCCSSTGRCRAGRDTTTAGERCRADAVAKV